jgi:hypothetical protein
MIEKGRKDHIFRPFLFDGILSTATESANASKLAVMQSRLAPH